jgi:hypothetical protein
MRTKCLEKGLNGVNPLYFIGRILPAVDANGWFLYRFTGLFTHIRRSYYRFCNNCRCNVPYMQYKSAYFSIRWSTLTTSCRKVYMQVFFMKMKDLSESCRILIITAWRKHDKGPLSKAR